MKPRISYNKHSTTIVSSICIPFALLTIVVIIISPSSSLVSLFGTAYIPTTFWIGMSVGTILCAWLGIASYKKSKKGYTQRDIANVAKTSSLIYTWKGAAIIIGIASAAILSANNFPPLLIGIAIGIFLYLPMLVLIDNFWNLGIFVWNSPDKLIKEAWYQGRQP